MDENKLKGPASRAVQQPQREAAVGQSRGSQGGGEGWPDSSHEVLRSASTGLAGGFNTVFKELEGGKRCV